MQQIDSQAFLKKLASSVPMVTRTDSLSKLVIAVQELSMARDMDSVTRIVRRVARELTGADGATFVLREGDCCFYADEDAIAPLWKGSRFPMSVCASGWVMLNRKSLLIEDIYVDDRIPIDAYRPTFVKSMAMVPIRTMDPLGAIGNYWARRHKPSEEEINLLKSLADITAVTIENIKVYSELEQRVKVRTAELEEKNREITDSIVYAKRLQSAILPREQSIRSHLPENFILYKPKAIVAGDFYWFEKKGSVLFLAVADCTGHGVPGAMVSLVCANALDRSVNEFGMSDTGRILDQTRELVLNAFIKSEKDVKDGMDISLCSINTSTGEVYWSGANNPLWYVHGHELHEVKAHKQPIGKTEHPSPFPTHKLSLEKGDMIYLVTDGFADQFGGSFDKKFKAKALKELLLQQSGNSMDVQKQTLEQVFENWRGPLEQVDDVTVIGIRL